MREYKVELNQENNRYPTDRYISLANVKELTFSNLILDNTKLQAHLIKLDFGNKEILDITCDTSINLLDNDHRIFKEVFFTLNNVEKGKASFICKLTFRV